MNSIKYKKLLEKINTRIGNIPLQELKPLHLVEYYNELRAIGKEPPHNKFNKAESTNKPLSENTILHHYNLIGGILHKAVDWDCLEKNPNDKVPRPKIKKYEPKFYDEQQVQELIKCLENESLKYRALIMLALDTGARRGELTGLEWVDIDFSKNCITINKITQRLNGEIIEKAPKTNSSIRKFQITDVTVKILKDYRQAQNSNIPEYRKLANILINWSEEILNSFRVPYTNGIIEGMNNKIKVIKRNAFGIRNFNRFRNRILHCFN